MVDVMAVARIMLALFLVGLNGFFVASEFAFVRMRESSIKEMAQRGEFGSKALLDVLDELDTYLAVTQLGITVASLGLGWAGEPAVADIIEPIIGGYVSDSLSHLIAFGIGFSTITFLHVVYGELAPKTLSIQETEKVAKIVVYPMKFFRYLFIPGIIIFNGAANKSTSLLGIEPAGESGETYTEDEIRNVVSESGRKGQVDEGEVEMIERIFEMDDMKVKEIMVPRPDVTVLNRDDEVSKVMDMVKDKNHTRYPVVDEDEVVGFVDIKDVFQTSRSSDKMKVEDIMDEIAIIPESASVKKALEKFQDSKSQMAGVVDEWGVFEGIVTVEDAVEVVVGNLQDKYDSEEDEPSVEETDDGYISDGSISISRLNNETDTEFEVEDIDTVAGLILSKTEDVPDVGTEVEIGDYILEVMDKNNSRIQEVRITRKESKDEEDSDQP